VDAKAEWGRVDGCMIAHIDTLVDIVFVTCNMSSNDGLAEHFRPSVFFLDEAGQAIDADIAIPPTGFKHNLHTLFLSGADSQLPPIVVSFGANEFSQQLGTSLFRRLNDLGTASTTIIQYSYLSSSLEYLPSPPLTHPTVFRETTHACTSDRSTRSSSTTCRSQSRSHSTAYRPFIRRAALCTRHYPRDCR